MKTDKLKEFLNSLSESIENDKIELFKKVIDSSEIKSFDNLDEFFYAVLYPWDKFITGYLRSELKANQDVEFIFKQANYIDRHFRNSFEKYEGTAFCADKSRTIVNRLLEFYTTGKIIEFDYEGEYTYHLPKKIFTDHQQIINFYEGLKDLYYARNDKYLQAFKETLIILSSL
jgi:AraC-like DNA-binding protein